MLVASAVGVSAAWDHLAAEHRAEGVIVADEATLRKGNGEGYQPQLERALPEGVEFRVLERRPDADSNIWYHVELRDGKDGWLRADRTEVL